MSENRETKEVITPIDKCKVILKAWITGREKRELRDIFLSKMSFSKEQDIKTEDNPAVLTNQAENKALETVIVSVNGKTEKIIDSILDMKSKDYDFVVNEVNKISKETDFLA